MKKIFSFLPACLLFVIFFSACNSDLSVKEYFKKYTETAAIEITDYNGNYQKDEDGVTCISSEEDKVIIFYLRNPQHYTLLKSFTFADNTLPNNPSNVQIEQDDNDKSIIRLIYSKDFLQSHEYGEYDLGGEISIQQEIIGGNRDFGTYKFDVRCNTEPPAVRNLTVLQYQKDALNEYYALAFNMPDMSSVHLDIDKILINNKEYKVTPVRNDASAVGVSDDLFYTDSNLITGLKTTGKNKIEFSGTSEERVLYYLTDIKLSDKEIPFTVQLIDKKGLISTSTVSALSEKLEMPTCSSDNEFTSITDEDGYYHISLEAPATNSDAYVYYEIYSLTSNSLVKKGYDKGIAKVPLAPGSYSIKIWAHKSGYVDSDVHESNISIAGLYFVDTGYVYQDGELPDGSKHKPFTDIATAINKSRTENFANSVITLLSDVELDDTLNINLSSFDSLTINGQSKYGIYCSEMGNMFINIPNTCLFNAVDLTVGTFGVNTGASVILSGTTHSYDDAVISLADITSKVYVNNLSGTKPIGIKYRNTQDLVDHKVVVAYPGSNAINESILNRFKINTNYYLEYENGFGIAKVSGFSIAIQDYPEFKVTITDKNNSLKYNNGVYSCKKGSILKASVTTTELSSVSISDITMALDLEGENVLSSDSNSITINPSYLGVYTLVIEFNYEGFSYSAQLTLNVEAQ